MHLELWDYYSTAKEVLDGEREAKSNGVPCDLYTGASSLTWMGGNSKAADALSEGKSWIENNNLASKRPLCSPY